MKHATYRGTLAAVLAAAALAVLPTACTPDEVSNQRYTLNARCEGINGSSDDAKVRLANEQWVMWEYDDMISIGSNSSTASYYSSGANSNSPNRNCKAWLYYSSVPGDFDEYNGTFLTELPEGSKYFLALHPYSDDNVIIPRGAVGGDSSRFATIQLKLPATQNYRNDSTFDKQVYPMLAWYGGEWDGGASSTAFNLNFRSLAGIVRLQFFNATSTTKTLSKITVTSATKQLSGLFSAAAPYGANPHLNSTSTAEADRTLTLDCSGVAFPENELVSFYMVLPALHGRDTNTTYSDLQVTLTTADDQNFSASLAVSIRRNGITYLNAVGINEWRSSGSTAERGLVGCGTATRPFKVYTLADLQYMRECYNSTERTINGQPITAETYIRIMRSDIAVRQESQWPSGIENFVGHLDYYGAANGVSGIVNNTKIPLFESIGSGGVVRGLTVYCDTNGLATVASLSPLCITNYGLIENCRVTSGSAANGGLHFSITSATGGLAGLCVTNKGTIKASGCEARLYCANRRVSGICLVNDGLIQGCYTSTPMYIESASRASSICDSNSATGTIRESYHGAGIATEASMSWGGIAYSNSGAIQRCYASETGPINTSGSVGGIVNTNYGGTVNECYNEASLQGTAVGGLVAYMRSGRVVNCYCNDDLLVLTQKTSASTLYAGGLIGMMSGGTVENCYAILNQVEGHSASGVTGGLVGRLRTGTIRYCYVYESNSLGHSFYGTTDGGTLESTCYLVGGSQSGVSSVDATASGYNALYTALSAGAGTSGYNAWVQSAVGTLPVLQSITPAKKRARR